jgi:hypothetical protein
MLLSAYAPAFLIVALRAQIVSLRIVAATLAVAGLLGLFIAVRAVLRQTVGASRITAVEPITASDVVAYLVPYALAFLVEPQPTTMDLIAYAMFVALTGVIYVRARLLRINPILMAIGYQPVRVRTESGASLDVFTRSRLLPGDELHTATLADQLRLARR